MASALSWLAAVCSWAWALARCGEFTGSDRLWILSCAVRFSSVVSWFLIVFSSALSVFVAVAVRLVRYAAANALAQAADCWADRDVQLIWSTEEFAGTATEMFFTRAWGVSDECRSLAAMAATELDWTICTSVSRLTALLVRPPATAPPP